jgi:uncharacterized membrane protein YgcG
MLAGRLGRQISPAYTLLEVILALALTTVILGLVGMAMHIHFSVADKSRGQVEEAQLARTLLQRIADDLRNTVPYGSGTTTTASGTATESSGTSTTSGTGSTGSGTSTASESETEIPIGIYGTAQSLQMDTSRRVRPLGMPKPLSTDVANCNPLSDVKTVTYSLGDPNGVAGSQGANTAAAATGNQTGLYRREIDRPAYVSAVQQGQADVLTQNVTQLASEVVNLQFAYCDGTTTYDTWDSTTQGRLPVAVKVTLMIRRVVPKSSGASAAAKADNTLFNIYDMLVDLPNAQIDASDSSGKSSGTSSGGTGSSGSGTSSGGSSGSNTS